MGFTEMLVLGAIALLVIGPKQLPEVARVIGRTLNELKRATGDLSNTFYSAKKDAESYFHDTSDYMHKQKQEFEKSIQDAIEIDKKTPEAQKVEIATTKVDSDSDVAKKTEDNH